MRFLKAALLGIAALFGAAVESGVGLLGWLLRSTWEGATGRSLAQEAAEREAGQTRVDEAAQAQADAQARHEEVALLAERHMEETRALRVDLMRTARRREEIAAQARSHDPEVRSSRWVPDDDPEPEGGAPLPAYA